MSYIKHLFIALLIVLGTAGISFSNSDFSVQKTIAVSSVSLKLDTDAYVYIDGILYHVFYDSRGNVTHMDNVE